jgi:homospermidine synthase
MDQIRKKYLGEDLYYKAKNEGVSLDQLVQRCQELGCTMEELKASSGFFGSIKIDLKDSKIFQIGFGGIGNNMLDLYLKHFTFKSGHIVICDKNPDILPLDTRFWDSGARAPETHNGIIFKNIHVTQENYKQVYREHLKQGDLLLDLGYYVDTLDSLIWCKENGVKFVNAAVEEWETNESNDLQYPQNEVRTYTLYHRQMKIQEITKKWGNSPTAILTHGANPGWCSSVTKIGMKHWVEYLKKNAKWDKSDKAMYLIKEKRWPELAKLMNIQVIQIAERDTLIQSIPRERGEFICTWSPQGMIEEAIAPAELGWGTHETMTESDGAYGYKKGPKNQVCFKTRGINTLVQSYVPSGNYVAMIIRHEEAYSLSDFLTVHDSSGKAVYRPTVYYAYYPCSDCIASIYEMQSNGFKQPEKLRLPKKELIKGEDELGCFMISKDLGSWWIGTIQSVADAGKLCPNQSPTTLVVTAGVMSAVMYAFNHPEIGVIHPEDMDEDEVMNNILPYLYPFVSFYVEDFKLNVQSNFKTEKDLASATRLESKKKESEDWTIDKFLL